MVRAKFRCVSREPGTEQAVVKFEAVTSGPGNESWSKWTPSGRIEMLVTNPDALAQFEPGKDYFIDFTPAE